MILVETHDLPLVSLSLYFAGGPAFDPPGKTGLTELTNRMLLRGTLRHGRAELEEAIEALGTELVTSTQRHAVALGVSLLARHLPTYLELLTEILTEPAFEPSEVAKVRREMLAERKADLDDDGTLARVWFRRKLFPDHPFGHGSHGRHGELETLTADDVRAHFEANYTQANLSVGAAGPMLAGALEAQLAPLIARLPEGRPLDWASFPPINPLQSRRVILVDKADRSQGQIVVGHPALDAADPDYLAVHLATTAFGGTFTARLMQEVRVKRGLSYGAYARLVGDRVGGYFTLSAAPEAADIAETLQLLFDEYARFVDEGLTDDEINFARDYLINAWVFGQETAPARVAQQLRAVLLGRPVDFPLTWPKTLAALSTDDIRDAVKRRLRPADLVAVIVCSAPSALDAITAVPGVTEVVVQPYDTLL